MFNIGLAGGDRLLGARHAIGGADQQHGAFRARVVDFDARPQIDAGAHPAAGIR